MMWRGFKKVLAERLPKAPPKGLLMYGMNRMIQIRRFRMPPPRIKRGESVLSRSRATGAEPRVDRCCPTIGRARPSVGATDRFCDDG